MESQEKSLIRHSFILTHVSVKYMTAGVLQWKELINNWVEESLEKSFSVRKYHNAELQAAKAYVEKALELYGDKATLNFPRDAETPKELKANFLINKRI